MTLSSVIHRLETAAGPSRELDEAITRAIGFKLAGYSANVPIWWNPDDKYVGVAPHYTSSLDAAMTLAPDGWMIHTLGQTDNGNWIARLVQGVPTSYSRSFTAGYEQEKRIRTAALALVIASIRARLAGQKE